MKALVKNLFIVLLGGLVLGGLTNALIVANQAYLVWDTAESLVDSVHPAILAFCFQKVGLFWENWQHPGHGPVAVMILSLALVLVIAIVINMVSDKK